GYNIYLDGELIEENYTETSYSDESAETIDYLTDGNQHIVEVVAVYENGTSVGSAVLVTEDTNVSEMTENNISVYPNPAKDFVKLSAVSGQLSAIKIYNCLGMLVEEIEVNANEVEINISEYNTGIYFINIQTENGNIVKKVVKK
ncbi:MAG: T9SS type A sorting domain-containing protein, partial [Bacteroidales bacterium]|nr:T9SS type A sorting domain-containing protein [Bacteroidales bacterium]